MIRFHPNITLAEASQAAAAAGMMLMPDWRGGAVIIRRSDAAALQGISAPNREQHGNLNTIRFPPHRMQIFGAKHPNPEEIEDA